MDLDGRFDGGAFIVPQFIHVEYQVRDCGKEIACQDSQGEAGPSERVAIQPGRGLDETLECRLRPRGVTLSDVDFFLENSRTPIPPHSDARYLAGQRVTVRGE